MYAAPFDHVVASSWEDAVRLLDEGGEDAKVIAGGQSLIPMMTLRLATPSLLVDVGRIEGPSIRREDGRLRISSLSRHADLERSPEVAESCPILGEAAALIGNLRVRHRGTIGGSLAHADPVAELPTTLVALEGSIGTLGPSGERTVPAEELFETYYTTTLGASEVVTRVDVPVLGPGVGWAFEELARRTGDFAIVLVAALIEMEEGRYRAARIVAGGIGERPVVLTEAQDALVGAPVGQATAAEAGRRASASADPPEGLHARARYRREMLGVLVRRAVLTAGERATGGDHR